MIQTMQSHCEGNAQSNPVFSTLNSCSGEKFFAPTINSPKAQAALYSPKAQAAASPKKAFTTQPLIIRQLRNQKNVPRGHPLPSLPTLHVIAGLTRNPLSLKEIAEQVRNDGHCIC